MYTAADFQSLVVDPTLITLERYSKAASQLVLGTALQESDGFHFRRQLGGGPALSYFQIEPNTHDDVWANYLCYHSKLRHAVESLMSNRKANKLNELANNNAYAAAICRVIYCRVKASIPADGDVKGMAIYWKQYYNTPIGGGTPEQFMARWKKYHG